MTTLNLRGNYSIEAADGIQIFIEGNIIRVSKMEVQEQRRLVKLEAGETVPTGKVVTLSSKPEPMSGKKMESLALSCIENAKNKEVTQSEMDEFFFKSGVLNDYDKEIDSIGLPRWKHRLLGLKTALTKRGKIAKERGVWRKNGSSRGDTALPGDGNG